MKKVKMRDANLEESFEKFKDSYQYNRISNKFRKKTYNQKNFVKFCLCHFLSLCCGIGSVYFAYVFTTEWNLDLVKNYKTAVGISIFVLFLLEILQRWSLGSL